MNPPEIGGEPWRSGPLAGLRIVEMRGIGPGPHCAMLLADLGADIVRIDRPGGAAIGTQRPAEMTPALRSRTTLTLDLKSEKGRAQLLRLVDAADGFLDVYRPGVAERLGIGPDTCLARNPRLVYARMTGYGQWGPLSTQAGHDINYLAVTGALDAIGRAGQAPTIPLNFVGDYGGGSLYLALGVVAGLLAADRSGRGQVVDVAMIDGIASLASLYYVLQPRGEWKSRGENYLDGGAPYYDTYLCADGERIAVGAIEDRFYDRFITGLGLDPSTLPERTDETNWPTLRVVIADQIRKRTRQEWCEHFREIDACVSPVLTFTEALRHPHHQSRQSFVELNGHHQPRPAPRFQGTPSAAPSPQRELFGADAEAYIEEWCLSPGGR